MRHYLSLLIAANDTGPFDLVYQGEMDESLGIWIYCDRRVPLYLKRDIGIEMIDDMQGMFGRFTVETVIVVVKAAGSVHLLVVAKAIEVGKVGSVGRSVTIGHARCRMSNQQRSRSCRLAEGFPVTA